MSEYAKVWRRDGPVLHLDPACGIPQHCRYLSQCCQLSFGHQIPPNKCKNHNKHQQSMHSEAMAFDVNNKYNYATPTMIFSTARTTW